MAELERNKLISRNLYNGQNGGAQTYSANHPNAVSDGDPKGKGNAQYLNVYDSDNTGGSLDILGNGEPGSGRIGNLTKNTYSRDNEYSAGNLAKSNGSVTLGDLSP